MPESMEDITSIDFSMLTYLQCFGGCGNAKDVGLMQYGLSFTLDAAIHGDLEGVREHAALMAVGLEQVAQDQRCWELGFQLMLLEDPPSQMWTFRNADLPQTHKSFCGALPSALGDHSPPSRRRPITLRPEERT